MQGKWIRKLETNTSIIFVHGVLSSGEDCWRHKNGTYWPELLKSEPELELASIYVFTYQTGLFSGSYRLGDTVDALKENMRLDGVLRKDRLIFVCHSMGGIVVRKFILERSNELIDAGKEIGLFLVASPSLGSSYADWLSPLAQLFGHSQADALRFVRDNDWLSDLDKEFNNLKEAGKLSINGKELVEDKFVFLKKIWRKQVVEPFSGARYFGEPFKIPGSDHFSIAKPENNTTIQHRLLCQFIKDTLDTSTQTISRSLAAIVGYWWQFVRNLDAGAILSLLEITTKKSRTFMLRGEAWDTNAEFLAEYQSTCERYEEKNYKLYYSWEGKHPMKQNIPLYIGVGEITFSPSSSNVLSRGKGWFYTSRLSDVKDALKKSTVYVRATPDDVAKVSGDDPDIRNSVIQSKLEHFKKRYT